jgi:hypothetical protein
MEKDLVRIINSVIPDNNDIYGFARVIIVKRKQHACTADSLDNLRLYLQYLSDLLVC